jgi:flavodoxin
MKILVTYYTKTGNTKAVADAIFEALHPEDKEIAAIKEVGSTDEYTLIFCGFPVHAHSVPVAVHNFIKKLNPGKKLALFSTHGSKTDGQMPREAIHQAVGLAKDLEVLGSYTCRGEVEPEIIDDLMNKPEHKAWAMEAASAKAHPDKADLEDARTFARGILKKALKFEEYHKK